MQMKAFVALKSGWIVRGSGKTRKDWTNCTISFGGGVSWISNYEVLVPTWQSASSGQVPSTRSSSTHKSGCNRGWRQRGATEDVTVESPLDVGLLGSSSP
jgi:hypothetical protein